VERIVTIQRRDFLAAATTAAFASVASSETTDQTRATGGTMYGLIGKIAAVSGQRAALAKVLLEGTRDMPGCLSYVIANDAAEADALWIVEVWDSKSAHQASLSLPAVQAAISRGRPMIAGFLSHVETEPIGGHGLEAAGRAPATP
jgi:quinol monooxygenase YgiN